MIHETAAMRAVLVLLGAFIVTDLQAQGTVRGELHDSLRTLGPLAGAEVVLSPGSRRATTDTRGRFAFENVPAGAYRVSYAPLWLDSVGVAPLSQMVDVPSRGSVDASLVVPGRAALALARCGGVMDQGRGLVVGEIRDANASPVAEAVVVARWSELALGAAADSLATQFVAVDTSGADGRYALCGMPDNAEVVVGARHPDGRRTGALVLVVDPGVLARDLLMGAPARLVRLRGRVVTTQGAPVPRADILASASTRGLMRSDSAGRFEVELPEGSRQVVVRALGFQPRLLDLEVAAAAADLGDVTLDPVAAVLDTVTIRAAPITIEELEFEQRRRTQTGSFIDERQLRRLPRATPAAVASLAAPWVQASQGDIYLRGVTNILGNSACKPRLFVDGSDWGNRTSAEEVQSLLQFARRIEVYQATFAPPEYSDFEGCGALVLWIQ